MAEQDFEDDLKAMFDRAPSAPDARAFAQGVDRRIRRAGLVRFALLAAFGLAGLALAWLQLGFSLSDLTGALARIAAAQGSQPDYLADSGACAAGLLFAGLGWLAVRPLTQGN